MKKRILSIMACVMVLIPMVVNAKGIEASRYNGLIKCKTTAYMLHGTTASGTTTRHGIAAGQDWMVDEAVSGDGSWVAMVWTEDGSEFLGYYEVLDKGGTEAIKNGAVIDIWCEDIDECQEWMELTQGKCLVRYMWSVG